MFAQGASRGIEALVAGFERQREEEKRLVDNAKIAESIMKVNPEMLERLELTPEQFKAMGAREKVALSAGAIQGVMNEARMEQAKAQQAADRSKLEYYGGLQAAQAEETAEKRARREGLMRFQEAEQRFNQTPELIRRPDRRQAIYEALVASGVHPEDRRAVLANEQDVSAQTPGQARAIEGLEGYQSVAVGPHSSVVIPDRAAQAAAEAARKPKEPVIEEWMLGEDEGEVRKRLAGRPAKEVKAILEIREQLLGKKGTKKEDGGLLGGSGAGLFERFEKFKGGKK